jgi:hypothetical protein
MSSVDKEQQEKLLSFAKPGDIKKALGAQTFYTMLATLEIKLDRKPKLTEIKKHMKENIQYLKPLLASEDFLQKYAQAVEKRSSADGLAEKEKRQKAMEAMSIPRRQYKGCLATKIKPEDYEACLINYDDPEAHYEKYSSIVPYNALKQKEYNKAVAKGDAERAKLPALEPEATIRDLPLGIRRYMKKNPEDFNNYLDEIKAEAKYLKTIKNNVSQKPRDQRRQLYEQLIKGDD